MNNETKIINIKSFFVSSSISQISSPVVFKKKLFPNGIILIFIIIIHFFFNKNCLAVSIPFSNSSERNS